MKKFILNKIEERWQKFSLLVSLAWSFFPASVKADNSNLFDEHEASIRFMWGQRNRISLILFLLSLVFFNPMAFGNVDKVVLDGINHALNNYTKELESIINQRNRLTRFDEYLRERFSTSNLGFMRHTEQDKLRILKLGNAPGPNEFVKEQLSNLISASQTIRDLTYDDLSKYSKKYLNSDGEKTHSGFITPQPIGAAQ